LKHARKQIAQPESVPKRVAGGSAITSRSPEPSYRGTEGGYGSVAETSDQDHSVARANGLLGQLSVENSDSTGTGLPVATPVVKTVATRDSFAQLRTTQDSDSTSQLKYGRTAVQRVRIQWKVSRDTE